MAKNFRLWQATTHYNLIWEKNINQEGAGGKHLIFKLKS